MPHIAFVARPRLAPGVHAAARTAARAWERAAERVAHLAPELTVVLGDLGDPAAGGADALAWAAECLQDWPTPVRCVPGAGDIALPGGLRPVDVGALLRFRRTVGADRWCQAVGPWRLAGLPTSLLGSGLEEEARLWSWLEALAARLDGTPGERRLVLCLDRPLLPGQSAARRLLHGVVGTRLAAVIAAAASPERPEGGALLQWLDAGLPGRTTPIEQLVLGPAGDGMGWLSLDEGLAGPDLEIGVARLDRWPAGDPTADAVVDAVADAAASATTAA